MLFAVLESKGKLRGKTKAQRKKEEKEKKSTGKTQGDELKDNLADNDDSSSTTTETSNPDVETNIREVNYNVRVLIKYTPSSAFTENMNVIKSLSHYFLQEPVTKKGRTVTTGKVKEETSNFLIKPKTKKQGIIKKETQAEKSRFA